MKLRESVAKMKRAVAAQFPEDAAAIDAQMEFFDEDAHEIWLERFCDTTNDAMARRDEQRVMAHLSFMSQQLELADDDVRRALDVAYVENLMWNLDLEARRWAWPRIPFNLKQLYLDTWGQPEL